MDAKTLEALHDAGCCDGLISELDHLPSICARICRLKTYRRDLLVRVHAEQRKLETLDYLIYTVQQECQTKE